MTGVIVYSTPGCIRCKMTKDAFEKKGVQVVEVQLADNPAAYEYVTEELGYSEAPVVVVDDNDHWSGFRPDQIARVAAAIA